MNADKVNTQLILKGARSDYWALFYSSPVVRRIV